MKLRLVAPRIRTRPSLRCGVALFAPRPAWWRLVRTSYVVALFAPRLAWWRTVRTSCVAPRLSPLASWRAVRTSCVIALALVAVGCVPELEVDESRIVAPRLLAVQATPAEVEPGERARYEALYVDDDGNVVDAPIAFFRCLRTRPLDELGPISSACLEFGAEALEDPPRALLGVGNAVDATTPFDICSLFGPDPRALEGGATSRPASPDSTGGYRQPIVVELPIGTPIEIATFEHRIRCNLAGARQMDAVAYRQRYRNNMNPELSSLRVEYADGREEDDPEEIALSVGETIEVTAGWPVCPEEPECGDGVCLPSEDATSCAEDCRTPRGCAGAELFLRYDAAAQTLVTEREAMRVFWSASRASFSVARTGVASEDRAATTSNTLRAEEPGVGQVHLVVRDERGGVGWRSLRLRIDP